MKRSVSDVGIFVIISFASSLVGCATQEITLPNSPADEASSIAADWPIVNDPKFGLSFSHPSSWGTWSLSKANSQENTDAANEMSFTILDSLVHQSQTNGKEDVNVILRRYDKDKYRYEEVCDSIQDLCDKMKKQDLLEEKNIFLKKADQTIGGSPATIQDTYDAPSGHVIREVKLYTSTQRVHLTAIYDIGYFLQIRQKHQDRDLLSVAVKILGEELGDPIHRLSKMYPEELKEMIKFYHDVDLFLGSIKVHD